STTRCGARFSRAGMRCPDWCPAFPATRQRRPPPLRRRGAPRPRPARVRPRARRAHARHRQRRPSPRARASRGPEFRLSLQGGMRGRGREAEPGCAVTSHVAGTPTVSPTPSPRKEEGPGSTLLLSPRLLLPAHPLHLLEEGGGPVPVAVGGQEGEQFLVRFLGYRSVVATDVVEGEADHRALAPGLLDQGDQ